MILDFIAVGVVVVCIGIIISIITKKFPSLAAINTDTIKKHQHDKVKKGLVESRLKRKLLRFTPTALSNTKKENGSAPKGPSAFRRFYEKLKGLEENYRAKIQETEPKDEKVTEKNKTLLHKEARELAEEGNFKEAEGKYIEAISLDKKYTDAYEGLAEAYVEMKDFEHAEEIYQYLLKLHTSTDEDDGNSGNQDTRQDGSPENGRDTSTSVSLNKDVAEYHVELGSVYIEMEQTEKALDCFLEAVKLEPNNPRNLDHLISAAIKIGRRELARKYVDKLAEANPENEKLKEFNKAIEEL